MLTSPMRKLSAAMSNTCNRPGGTTLWDALTLPSHATLETVQAPVLPSQVWAPGLRSQADSRSPLHVAPQTYGLESPTPTSTASNTQVTCPTLAHSFDVQLQCQCLPIPGGGARTVGSGSAAIEGHGTGSHLEREICIGGCRWAGGEKNLMARRRRRWL